MLNGVGGQALMSASLTAFFASRQCPGFAIRAAIDWAIEQARARQTIISSFHSPLEQSVLEVLLQARSPVVAVLARPVTGAKLSADWKAAILEGRMAVVSDCSVKKRLTSEQAMQRNELTAQLADAIFIAHASAGGVLARQSSSWVCRGLQVVNLSSR